MRTALPLCTTGKKTTSRVMNIPDKLWNTPLGLSSYRKKLIRSLRSQRENRNEACPAVERLLIGLALSAMKDCGRKFVEATCKPLELEQWMGKNLVFVERAALESLAAADSVTFTSHISQEQSGL
jgi:hypothetical protein